MGCLHRKSGVPSPSAGPGLAQGEPVAATAKNLGISESCLRRWKAQAEVDAGHREGLTGAEELELVELRRKNRVLEMEIEILKPRLGVLRPGERPPKRVTRQVHQLGRELAEAGLPVAVTCRVLGLPRSTYYDAIARPLSARAAADGQLLETIRAVHADSRATYGAPRVHAELRLGLGIACGRKRVARLMRHANLQGVCHRRKGRSWRPLPAPHADLVQRRYTADGPDRVWFTDITQHRAGDGWVYCCAVMDAFSRRVVGWSIADHLRAELVVDALEMARCQRRPPPGTVVHADRGTQYTSWLFGHRLRQAGLLGSMGSVASSVDNALIESFWSSMQRELLDRRSWTTRVELATAMFEWIEGWYNPRHRHSALGCLASRSEPLWDGASA